MPKIKKKRNFILRFCFISKCNNIVYRTKLIYHLFLQLWEIRANSSHILHLRPKTLSTVRLECKYGCKRNKHFNERFIFCHFPYPSAIVNVHLQLAVAFSLKDILCRLQSLYLYISCFAISDGIYLLANCTCGLYTFCSLLVHRFYY